MPRIYYQFNYSISETRVEYTQAERGEIPSRGTIPGTDNFYRIYGILTDPSESGRYDDFYSAPNQGFDYYKRSIGSITNVEPGDFPGVAPGFGAYSSEPPAWGSTFLSDEEYANLLDVIPPEIDDLGGFSANNSGGIFGGFLSGYSGGTSFRYSAPTITGGALAPGVDAQASVSVGLPGLNALANPVDFMIDSAKALITYTANGLGVLNPIANAVTVYDALSDVHRNALDVFEYGIENFETLDAAEYDAMVDQLLRDSQGRFIEALGDVSGLQGSPLFEYTAGVNLSVGPLEVEADVTLSIGVETPDFLGLDLPDPTFLALEGERITIMPNSVSTVQGSDDRDVVINPSQTPNPLNGPQMPWSVQLNGGDDVYIGGSETEDVIGGDGNDTLRGGFGDDVLSGDDYQSFSLQGHDALFGEQGDDDVIAGGGDDVMDGGTGQDWLGYFDAKFGAITADLETGTITGRFDGTAFTHRVSDFEILGGGTGDDVLRGSSRGEELEGDAGDDRLFGRGGDDDLEGGPGNDTIDGGAGFDRAEYDNRFHDAGIVGSLLAGTVTGTSGGVAFTHVLSAIEAIEGSAHNDSLEGDPGANLLMGDDGADTLRGREGDDTLRGGDGTDRAEFASAFQDVTVSREFDGLRIATPSEGRDLVAADVETLDFAGTGFEFDDIAALAPAGAPLLRGSEGGGPINGTDGDESILGLSGDDTILSGAGRDSIDAGAGDDLIDDARGVNSTSDPNAIDAGEGDDTVFGTAANDTLAGGDGSDSLFGEGGDDSVLYGAGLDTVFGGQGDDTIDDAAGPNSTNDPAEIFGGPGNDRIFGTAGADALYGGDDDDAVHGEAGADRMFGGLGNDLIFGGTGFDTISSGDGADTVHGGDGRDLVFLNQGNDIFFDTGQGGELGRDTVWGGFGNDTIQGGNGDDLFYGEAGNDLINGRLGADLIFGGTGFDTISAGDGADTVHGGDGRDLVFLNQGNDLFIDTGQAGPLGNDTVWTGLGDDTVQGGNGADVFYGEAGNDVIFARLGNDTVFGGSNFDVIDTGAGDDLAFGGLGRDTVVLGDGNDRFVDTDQTGTLGQDTITGGLGEDVFVFGAAPSADTITDFQTGSDLLELAGALAAGRSAAQIAADGQVTAEGVLLDFGGGNSILLAGLTATTGLEGDILIV